MWQEEQGSGQGSSQDKGTRRIPQGKLEEAQHSLSQKISINCCCCTLMLLFFMYGYKFVVEKNYNGLLFNQ